MNLGAPAQNHALQYFKPIDLSSLLPTQASDSMSQLWSDALHGLFRYDIATTWDGRPLTPPFVEITLQGFEAGVEMNVTAPFYNDTAPLGTPGQPFYRLWDYEVVEMFFLNKNNEYLEVEMGPWGQHLLLLLKGARNVIKHSLPLLDYIITERTDPEGTLPGQWKGSAMIPPDYFPPNVTFMNAYAMHGDPEEKRSAPEEKRPERQYLALYPAPQDDPSYQHPDFPLPQMRDLSGEVEAPVKPHSELGQLGVLVKTCAPFEPFGLLHPPRDLPSVPHHLTQQLQIVGCRPPAVQLPVDVNHVVLFCIFCHQLDLFRAIDFEFQVKDNINYSQIWQDAMDSGASSTSVVSGASVAVVVVVVVVVGYS
ncbi:UPF0462 protein C4orf33 [Chionoecetes opilio]|uniref:UPF0462 protein C4orf33 n=1 Tax=Chionoecetes opilio TaxID=41210 RepID=A0A8J5CMP5_CHIOP|nr:UPF0462 protein C4orf33 [Chionoecetes opilio]